MHDDRTVRRLLLVNPVCPLTLTVAKAAIYPKSINQDTNPYNTTSLSLLFKKKYLYYIVSNLLQVFQFRIREYCIMLPYLHTLILFTIILRNTRTNKYPLTHEFLWFSISCIQCQSTQKSVYFDQNVNKQECSYWKTRFYYLSKLKGKRTS